MNNIYLDLIKRSPSQFLRSCQETKDFPSFKHALNILMIPINYYLCSLFTPQPVFAIARNLEVPGIITFPAASFSGSGLQALARATNQIKVCLLPPPWFQTYKVLTEHPITTPPPPPLPPASIPTIPEAAFFYFSALRINLISP